MPFLEERNRMLAGFAVGDRIECRRRTLRHNLYGVRDRDVGLLHARPPSQFLEPVDHDDEPGRPG